MELESWMWVAFGAFVVLMLMVDLVAFGILVLVLIFKPGGFLGAPEEKRA